MLQLSITLPVITAQISEGAEILCCLGLLLCPVCNFLYLVMEASGRLPLQEMLYGQKHSLFCPVRDPGIPNQLYAFIFCLLFEF